MSKKSGPQETAEKHVKDIKRRTRRKFAAEEKIHIVLGGESYVALAEGL